MKTHTGGCHCGGVRYSVSMDLEKVIECNCSYCTKQGLLLAFTPEESFTLLEGNDLLREYRFNNKTIQHLACTTCGVQSFGRAVSPEGVPTVAINVRTLDDVDLSSLTRIPFDGKSR